MEKALIHLSDEQLLRLILIKLWNLYDTGGISFGRSERALCVECIQDLMPIDVFWNPEWKIGDYCLEKIELEVAHRVKLTTRSRQMLLFDREVLPVEAVPTFLLVRILLKHLMDIYEIDIQERELCSYTELALVQAAHNLFPLPERYPNYSLDEIHYSLFNQRILEANEELVPA